MTRCLCLPLTFQASDLALDLARIAEDEWMPHYNKNDYEGEWTGVALRAVGGSATNLYADPSPQAVFVDTPILARCSHFRSVLSQFKCPLRAVRLLRLRPGARIREHRDPGLGPLDAEVRLHVPVATNHDVEFVVAGRPVVMNVGETWFIDFTQPHRVANRGATDRVHLVLDCTVNDWLRDMMNHAHRVEDVPYHATASTLPPTSVLGFEPFRAEVMGNLALQEELREIADAAYFVERVIQLGAERGFAFSAADVEEAMRVGRRAWLERWIV